MRGRGRQRAIAAGARRSRAAETPVTRGRRSEQGQAVVELAIMSVMFVTVLLFGIYFAEVGYISQKVQEAAAYATFDASGRRVHDFDQPNLTGNFNAVYRPYRSLNGYLGVAGNARTRYQDFDGVMGNGNVFTQVMTSATDFRISCRNDNRIGFAIPNVRSSRYQMPAVMDKLQDLYKDRGGVSCTASATVNAVNFPGSFLDRDVLSKEELYDGDPIRVCGAGRAVNGRCQGSYGILTGDWAFDQARMGGSYRIDEHSKQARDGRPSGSRRNPGYRQLVRDLYMANGDSKQSPGNDLTRAQEMISIGGGYTPAEVRANDPWDDRKFLMSYAGEEDNFTDALERTRDPDNPTDTEYNTSGVYIPRWQTPPLRRAGIRDVKLRYKNCFLGIAREGCR